MKQKPKFERVEVPKEIVEVAWKRTAFLRGMTSRSVDDLLANAYLAAINDLGRSFDIRSLPPQEP